MLFRSGPATRSFFVQVMSGRSITVPGNIPVTTNAWGTIAPAVDLPDAHNSQAVAIFSVPQDYASDLTVTAVVSPEIGGNAYVYTVTEYGPCGTVFDNRRSITGYSPISVTQNFWNCINSLTLTAPAAGDMVLARFYRSATDPLDTIAGDLYVFGFQVEYVPIS